jgi:dTDP-glucose pyrophosphorylase
MKALILAAGKGTRFGGPKTKALVCGKPLIEYAITYAKLARVDGVVVVTNEIQKQPLGIVDAIRCANVNEDFLLLLADEIYIKPRHHEMVSWFNNHDVFGICGVIHVRDKDRIKGNYSIETSPSGRILRCVEKPANPPNNMMGVGSCVFKKEILDYSGVELPELIQGAIDDYKTIIPFAICDEYFNINTPQDREHAEEVLQHGSNYGDLRVGE